MSEDNINILYSKSHSEGELIHENQIVNNKNNMETNTIEKSRLKRTFTLPRNPFSNKNIQKYHTNTINNHNNNNKQQQQSKIFKKTSWKKFINKITQHIHSVGVTTGKNVQQDWNNRVPPVNPINSDHTPGVTGLRNHGNTCFMNAVLQCLSHTDMIAEYFVLDAYKADLSRRSRTNSRKLGTKGELTEQLALLLKALWAGQYCPELSTTFKTIVERYGTQYRGSSQHDAQEFLLWLLDKVHEDLNTATKKKYKTIKNSVGRPDEVVAAETLANHLRCNSSFVQAVFQAQFRSSLACPRCHRQSNTFDPFHCISVQLPHLPDHPLLVTVVYANQQPRCVRLGIRIAGNSMVRDLRSLLHSDTGISSDDIVLVEITNAGIGRTLSDCQPLWPGGCPPSESAESSFLSLYCIEAPPLLSEQPSEPYILLMWINVLMDGESNERFGTPYVLRVPREVGYEDLQKLILKEMSGMVNESILGQYQPPGEPKLRLISPIVEPTYYLQSHLEHPLYAEVIDQTLALSGERSGPQHLQLIAEWDKQLRDGLLSDWTENVEQHSSVAEVTENPELTPRLSLSDCLNHYTRAETLAMEDAWRCPQCQQYLPVVKTLGLWSLPDILVIHLKRFRQQQIKGRNSTKLTTMVDFPLYGFDMSPHLANRDATSNGSVVLGGAGWSPWRKPVKVSVSNDNSYDLYAVCYHHGNDLETGHYTAACKNPYDQQWYKFDDIHVTHIPNEDVTTELVNNSAYILFYQRRNGNFTCCSSNSSSAASSSSVGSNNEHWSARMPKFTYQPKKDSEKVVSTTKVSSTVEPISSNPSQETRNVPEKNERNLTKLAESLNSKCSISSLKDMSSKEEQQDARLEDENNLRNSISLCDNLSRSTGDVNVNNESREVSLKQQVILDVKPEEMINKDSLFNMGESRRNTLSEYKNNDNEFVNNNNITNDTINYRNSLSLTVTPYPPHKDIHVNPKMTVRTSNIHEIFKVEMKHLKQANKHDTNQQSPAKENQSNPEFEQFKKEFTQFKSGLIHSEMRRELEGWMRQGRMGWTGYALDGRRHDDSNVTMKNNVEEEHGATIPPDSWKSPSLKRPVMVTQSDK